jgi:hypothetical protein
MYLVSNAQKSPFTNAINEFAEAAELKIEKVDVLNSMAVFSKQFGDSKQYLEYFESEGYVALKVNFYSLNDLSKLFPTEADMVIFAFSLLVMNDNFPFGTWGLAIKPKPDTVAFLSLQYGILREKLDKRYFTILSASMMESANEYEKTLKEKYGFGIASKNIIEELKSQFREIAVKQKQIFLKNIAK